MKLSLLAFLLISLFISSTVLYASGFIDLNQGLAIVQVNGAMSGSGSLIAINNKIYVLTPSHIIQNSVNPKVQLRAEFINSMITDDDEIRHFKDSSIPASDFNAEVIYSNPLDDIALLRIPELKPNYKLELYEKLLYIAKRNLHFCSGNGKGCFNADSYKNISKYFRHSERISWIYNNDIYNQFQNLDNSHIELLNNDEYISGLYSNIIKTKIYGGPGMSGGILYFNNIFGGMVVKVHYDGYPAVYVIPTDQIYEKIKFIIELLEKNHDIYQIERLIRVKSSWISKRTDSHQFKNYIFTSFKDQWLLEAVGRSPFAPGGGPGGGSVGSGGGPGGGSIGSSGIRDSGISVGSFETNLIHHDHDRVQNENPTEVKPPDLSHNDCQLNLDSNFYSLTGLPTIESKILFTNPFLASSPEFYINDDRICRIKLDDGRTLLTHLAQYIYYSSKDKVEVILKECNPPRFLELTRNIDTLPLKHLKFYILKSSKNDCSSQPFYEYNRAMTFSGYRITVNPDEQSIEVFLNNSRNIQVKKFKLYYDEKNSEFNLMRFQSKNRKQRAIMFFNNELKEEKLTPFSLFIQSEEMLIQAEW